MPKSSDVIVPIAVVGCGYWGVNYLRLLSELPHAVLAGVCDQNRDRVSRADISHDSAHRSDALPLEFKQRVAGDR